MIIEGYHVHSVGQGLQECIILLSDQSRETGMGPSDEYLLVRSKDNNDC